MVKAPHFALGLLLVRSATHKWSSRRHRVVETHAKMKFYSYEAISAGLDLFDIINLPREDQWKFDLFPLWFARAEQLPEEKGTRLRREIHAPWVQGELWVAKFVEQLKICIDYLIVNPGYEEIAFKLQWDPKAYPNYRRAIKKLKELWRKRPEACRPRLNKLHLLPLEWQKDVEALIQ